MIGRANPTPAMTFLLRCTSIRALTNSRLANCADGSTRWNWQKRRNSRVVYRERAQRVEWITKWRIFTERSYCTRTSQGRISSRIKSSISISMKSLHTVTFILVVVGALNWGLVGLSGLLGGGDWNLVKLLVGSWPVVENLVYLLVCLLPLFWGVQDHWGFLVGYTG